jgi:succinyl-CoA synthetase beta subunit
LLHGVRGQPAVDLDELKRVLHSLADLVEQEPEIEEIDINPLFIHGSQIKAGDALITLRDNDE